MLHKDSNDIHLGAFVQSADPGAIKAGILWVDTSGAAPVLRKRNSGNTAWDAVNQPMTAVGDLIVGGVGGNPVRLAVGTNGQVLTLASGTATWASLPTPTLASDSDVTITSPAAGDRLVYNAGTSKWVNQQPTLAGESDVALSSPATGQVLTYNSTSGKWSNATPTTYMSNPMTTAGDVIVGGASGAPGRLAVGSNGQVLTVVAGALAWATPTAGSSTLAADTDVAISSPTNGQVLTYNSTSGKWVNQASSGGSGGSGGGTPVAVQAYATAGTSVPSGTATPLALGGTQYDQGTSTPQHSTTSTTSRLTAQVAGVYAITSYINGGVLAGTLIAGIRLNGTTFLAAQGLSGGLVEEDLNVSAHYYLNVGDYVEATLYQSSGSTQTVGYASGQPSRLAMALVGGGGGGSSSFQFVHKSANYTLTTSDTGLIVDTTGITITLPTAVGATQVYTVKLGASVTSCTLATTSSQTIDGLTAQTLSGAYNSFDLASDGANWFFK